MEHENEKLILIATKTLTANPDLIYVVDFLNKNLKHKKVMFGLTLNKEEKKMTLSIYEV